MTSTLTIGALAELTGCNVPIAQVRALITLAESPDRDCSEARDVAEAHLATVRKKLAELKALERSLAHFVASATAACAGGAAPQCVLLEDLAQTYDTAS
jgi:hypothetical protein